MNTQFEIENRIKNLMWTVSGDYSLNVKPDVEAFYRSKQSAIYEAIKQGAFAKYFDKELMALYLVKKIYLSAEEQPLLSLSQLCVDAACSKRISKERSGVAAIRKEAFSDILELDFPYLSSNPLGRLKIAILQKNVLGEFIAGKDITLYESWISGLTEVSNTYEILVILDRLYNTLIDPKFEQKHGNLNQVLAVTMEELNEFNWKDFLDEELYETVEQYMENAVATVTQMSTLMEKEKREKNERTPGKHVIVVDEKALERMYSYIELNHGRSYLSEQEQERLNHKLCTGLHKDCKLYFTDGILHNAVKSNYQLKYAQLAANKNKLEYYDKHRIVKRNIVHLADMLKRTLMLRNEREFVKADNGVIRPVELWKPGRLSEYKLFHKEITRDNSDFVVELLMDASGSQSARRAKVALQGYIISEALTSVSIPVRVMSFCAFWDYTIMRRFREYEEGREANERIFEYTASSNNRDGLAIRAAVDSLIRRNEENKILIVLSDARPNDMVIGRPGTLNQEPYGGEEALKDTALEVRKARKEGILVLGVFAGEEEDLGAEKRIFGSDFAYIRDIANFSSVVGRYLKKQLEDL